MKDAFLAMTTTSSIAVASDALSAAFENAIRISVHEATRRAAPNSAQEPDYIAMLVLQGVPYISRALRAILAPMFEVAVTAVFCHQKPEVQFNRGKYACELGDILFAHIDYGDGTQWAGNSLLLQAKLCNALTYTVPVSERHQLALYGSWPTFTYVRSGAYLNGKTRSVRPRLAHPGAQYLLVDSEADPLRSGLLGFPGTHCMAVWPASAELLSVNSLAVELIRLLVGTTGRRFERNDRKDPTGWSTVVWDLLHDGLSRTFTRRRVGVSNERRALTGVTWQLTFEGVESEASDEATLARLSPPTGSLPESRADDDRRGVSLVIIETRSREQPRG